MKKVFLCILFVLLCLASFGQVQFNSSYEDFQIDLPVVPSEKLDTIFTEFGHLPRYLMISKTVDHGRNLIYTVEVLSFQKGNEPLTLLQLKNFLIQRKRTGKLKFYILEEKVNKEESDPYEVELVFVDAYGESLNFVKLFILDTKFYSVETYQLKGAFKLGTKPNKLTREYFSSIKIQN